MQCDSRMTGLRPILSESAPSSGARKVSVVQKTDWRRPYLTGAMSWGTTSRTRKGNTGTSTVFASCATMMIVKGPKSICSGAHEVGDHCFQAPSGMWIVTGTQIWSSPAAWGAAWDAMARQRRRAALNTSPYQKSRKIPQIPEMRAKRGV